MFKDTKEGQTNYCTHKNNNTSGICDECLGKNMSKEKLIDKKELVDYLVAVKNKIAKDTNTFNQLNDEYEEGYWMCLNDLIKKY